MNEMGNLGFRWSVIEKLKRRNTGASTGGAGVGVEPDFVVWNY